MRGRRERTDVQTRPEQRPSVELFAGQRAAARVKVLYLVSLEVRAYSQWRIDFHRPLRKPKRQTDLCDLRRVLGVPRLRQRLEYAHFAEAFEEEPD